jgi:hypothetical protein
VFDGEDYLKVPAPGQMLTKFDGARPTLGMDQAKVAK